MKRFFVPIFVIVALSTNIFATCKNQNLHLKKYDVVVYGGTSGGVAAAIQIARMGKSVALIEPSSHVGGNVVEGLGSTDIDNHKEFQNSFAIGGIALEFYRRIAKAYNREADFEKMLLNREKNRNLWTVESSVAEKVIADWLHEYPIDIYYNTRLSENKQAVLKKGTQIVQISMENGSVFKAKQFIDATIEGDLIAGAGITTNVGRESSTQYNEPLNGVRSETTHAQFLVNVNPYKNPNDTLSGLIATIQNEPLGIPGSADKRLQAYCFRVCLTKSENNKIPFYKPQGYNRGEYEIYLRYLKAGGKLYTPYVNLPNGKTDLGAWHDLSHNLYGMNVDYPLGNYATRKKILEYHKKFTQGLFYFLSTDSVVRNLDAELQKEWASWGYAKDEFTDNNGFPRNFYVRDARRMVSDYVITQKMGSSENKELVKDPIAVAFWPMDIHSVRRIVKDGLAYNEGFVFNSENCKPFGVSYRALVPKRNECTNLITPTCLSSSHIAYGAIRLEFNFMAHGQAAGAAAVLAINNKCKIQNVDYELLKLTLLKAAAVLDAEAVSESAVKAIQSEMPNERSLTDKILSINGLVALWDFKEKEGHARESLGSGNYLLKEVDGTLPRINEGPLSGYSAEFKNQAYLRIPNEETGKLNISGDGKSITVVAWVKWDGKKTGFVGGMWNEHENGGKRQYGLFISLPEYNGLNQVCGHISKIGKATPPFPYSIDYSASKQEVPANEWVSVAFTYDGEFIKSYFNGVFEPRKPELINNTTGYNGYPNGLIQSKNPYYFPNNMGDNGSDFTVGAVLLKSGMGNYFRGQIGGLAVFDRVLTDNELLNITK